MRRGGETPVEYVTRLACEKAAVAEADGDEIVLGADTTVVVDGTVFEKPQDAADAVRMLKLLSGREHEVITGICLRRGGVSRTAVSVTRVWFSMVGEEEIGEYVASGEPMDKAGAYAIQGWASRWVARIDGCYFNVVGLPVSLVWSELKKVAEGG